MASTDSKTAPGQMVALQVKVPARLKEAASVAAEATGQGLGEWVAGAILSRIDGDAYVAEGRQFLARAAATERTILVLASLLGSAGMAGPDFDPSAS